MELKGKILLKEEPEITINPCQEVILQNIVNMTHASLFDPDGNRMLDTDAIMNVMLNTEWTHPGTNEFMRVFNETGNIFYTTDDEDNREHSF